MKKVIFICILIIFNSCTNPKFFNEFNEINNALHLRKKEHKLVFKKLENQLLDTKKIVYYFQPSFNINDDDFTGVVYDIDKKVYYYINYKNKNINVDFSFKNSFSNYQIYNIDLFVNANLDKIKYQSDKCSYSGPKSFDYLFFIDLEKNQNRKLVFKNYFYCYDLW